MSNASHRNGIGTSLHGEAAFAQKRGGVWYFRATGTNVADSTLPRRGRFTRSAVESMLYEDVAQRLYGRHATKSKGWVAGFASTKMTSPDANRTGMRAPRKARRKGERPVGKGGR